MVRNYFKTVLDELMEAGEEECSEVVADLNSAIALRDRLLALSNFLKAHKSKVDEKNNVLRAEIVGNQHNMMNLPEGM